MSQKPQMLHPVAVLRTELELDQKSFAIEIGYKSARPIREIERLERPLTAKVAEAIQERFYVSKEWLLAGDPTAPRVDFAGGYREKWPQWYKLDAWLGEFVRELHHEEAEAAERYQRLLGILQPVMKLALENLLHRRTATFDTLEETKVCFNTYEKEVFSTKPFKVVPVSISLWELAQSVALWETRGTMAFDMLKSGNREFRSLPGSEAPALLNLVIKWEASHFDRRTGPYRFPGRFRLNRLSRARHTRVWKVVNRIAKARFRKLSAEASPPSSSP